MAVSVDDANIRPILNNKIAMDLVKKLYGFDVIDIQELNGYDDKNYRVVCDNNYDNIHVNAIAADGYVLKVLNSLDSQDKDFVEGQNEMMLYLRQRNINCPVPILNLSGLYYSSEKIDENDETTHIIRLLLYCPGEILHNAKLSSKLFFNVGVFVANLINTLGDFVHSSYENRVRRWSLLSVPQLRNYISVVTNDKDKLLISEVINCFEVEILANIHEFEKGIIHGDINEQNIIVDDEQINVKSIIDFGDAQYSCLIFELILTIFYMIMQSRDIKMGKYVVEGFQSLRKLSNLEKKILKIGVCARACQSLVLGVHSHIIYPDDDYLLVTQKPGWEILRQLWPMSIEEVSTIWEL